MVRWPAQPSRSVLLGCGWVCRRRSRLGLAQRTLSRAARRRGGRGTGRSRDHRAEPGRPHHGVAGEDRVRRLDPLLHAGQHDLTEVVSATVWRICASTSSSKSSWFSLKSSSTFSSTFSWTSSASRLSSGPSCLSCALSTGRSRSPAFGSSRVRLDRQVRFSPSPSCSASSRLRHRCRSCASSGASLPCVPCMFSLGLGKQSGTGMVPKARMHVPDTRLSLERIRQLDLGFQHLNAPRCLAGGQIPRILRGLIRLFAQPLQPEALRPRHLLGEESLGGYESLGVVFTLDPHVAAPLRNRDLTICSYFVLTSHGQQN